MNAKRARWLRHLSRRAWNDLPNTRRSFIEVDLPNEASDRIGSIPDSFRIAFSVPRLSVIRDKWWPGRFVAQRPTWDIFAPNP